MTESQKPAPTEDEQHRKFREALDRKMSKVRSAHGEAHLDARGAGPANNDKHQRQFRRKSG